MLVVVVDSAPLPDEPAAVTGSGGTTPVPPDAGAGRLRTLHLHRHAELAEEVVAEIMRSRADHCFVVGDLRQAAVIRRTVGFARQALWRTRVTGWAAPASPFRLAVALARLQSMHLGAPLPRGGHEIALKEIVRQTHGVMATASARRLRSPRPSLLQRLTFPRRGGLFLVPDRTSVTSVWVLRPQALALPPYLRPDPVEGGHVALVSAGTDAPDVTALLDLLEVDATATTCLNPDPAWTSRWGTLSPVEIVLEPAAEGLLERNARAAVARSWGCTWCEAKVSGLESCAVCGAGAPTTESARPSRRRRVPALQGG